MGEWLGRARRRHPRDAGGAGLHRGPAGAARRRVGRHARPRDREGSRGRRDRLAARKATIHRVELGDPKHDFAGRWLEADYEVDDRIITVVSTYVHSGDATRPEAAREVPLPRRDDQAHARARGAQRRSPLVVGDLNVGHRELDIRNWKGNRTKAGFLPKERAYFDRFFSPAGKRTLAADGVKRVGLGWVDVGRTWSRRGRRPVHVVVADGQGVRQRQRDGASTTSWPRPRSRPPSSTTPSTARRPTTSAGATTRRWSSTTRCDGSIATLVAYSTPSLTG